MAERTTVAALMAQLATFPPDAEVFIEVDGETMFDITADWTRDGAGPRCVVIS